MINKSNGNWWKYSVLGLSLTGMIYIITGIVTIDRLTIKVDAHEKRIAVMEQVVEKQELRDYILIQTAEKLGIRIPERLK